MLMGPGSTYGQTIATVDHQLNALINLVNLNQYAYSQLLSKFLQVYKVPKSKKKTQKYLQAEVRAFSSMPKCHMTNLALIKTAIFTFLNKNRYEKLASSKQIVLKVKYFNCQFAILSLFENGLSKKT